MSKVEEALRSIAEFRRNAAQRQQEAGAVDAGMRSEVTSGGHLDAIAAVISETFTEAGIPSEWVFGERTGLELPGYFRAEKKWDIVVAHRKRLIAAIEFKSIWGSYGNNINNRVEEAVGSASDIAKALRPGLLGSSAPWLGYVFVIRDDGAIHRETRFKEPHFPVDKVFDGSTYLERFGTLCSRLVAERLYDNVWFVCVDEETGTYKEPNAAMTWSKFEAAIKGKVMEELA
jgi:hypothetical protein